jgi:hypothetical protein
LVLAKELEALRSELQRQAVEIEHAAVGVASAEAAVKRGDVETAQKQLKAAGKWALDAATKIGVQVAGNAIEAALKLK